MPSSSGTNNSEVVSEGSCFTCWEHDYRRRLPDHQTGWASALGFALFLLAASLFLVAVLLTYNIQPPSSAFGNNKEPYTTPPDPDTGRPILMADPPFKTGQGLPPRGPRVPTRISRRKEAADAVARLEVQTRTLPTAMRNTSYGEISEAKLVCGAVYYSYCTRSAPKFYYDPWEKACTASRGNNGVLCLKGSNRFPSKGSCERNCVLSERSSPRCADATTFASCTRSEAALCGTSTAAHAACGNSLRASVPRAPRGRSSSARRGSAKRSVAMPARTKRHRDRRIRPAECHVRLGVVRTNSGKDEEDVTCQTVPIKSAIQRMLSIYGRISITTSIYVDVQVFEKAEHSSRLPSGLQVGDGVILDAKIGPLDIER
ncbi:hypothetical protein HPB48_015321 [Haemaphysalis longicornis]|uniref:BPTI/Kunitz inhibitor domain-containing protein n=1 Tax=Haemaphysalis longicornis TaxID=44386 RepID=A0A9J6GJT5_HAELO|nr:hypothetical protein HPB48_015321 [Haemaphysalis longicornis]